MRVVRALFDAAKLPVFWREADARWVLDAWRASEQSMAACARDHRVPVERIRRWRRRLECDAGQVASPRFVQLVVDPPAATASLRALVGGVAIEVSPGFDDETLARVVELLSC